jgi:hypothetical protein
VRALLGQRLSDYVRSQVSLLTRREVVVVDGTTELGTSVATHQVHCNKAGHTLPQDSALTKLEERQEFKSLDLSLY